MLKSKLKKGFLSSIEETKLGTQYVCEFAKEEYLHIMYAGLDSGEEKKLKKELERLKKEGPYLDNYISFLKEVNGAILYAGSINLFGYEGRRKDMDAPTSVIRENKVDRVSSVLNQVIYIGNMPCVSGGNINLYFNVKSRLVSGYYDGEIAVTWTSLEDFFDKVLPLYEEVYTDSGVNVKQGENDKAVYNNIQKYNLKES